MKTFLTISGGILLALSCVTASDARPHAQPLHPSQSESPYYDTDYSQRPTRGWDSSCFAGLPAMYACSSNGGGALYALHYVRVQRELKYLIGASPLDSADELATLNDKLAEDQEYSALVEKYKDTWFAKSMKDTLVTVAR